MRLSFPGTRRHTIQAIAAAREEYATALPLAAAAVREAEAAADAAIARREAERRVLNDLNYRHQRLVDQAEKSLRDGADPRLEEELNFLRILFQTARSADVLGQPELERTPSGRAVAYRPSMAAEMEQALSAIRAAEAELRQLQLSAASSSEITERILELRRNLPPMPRAAQQLVDEHAGKLARPSWWSNSRAAE
jgi:hypothetical protein